MRPLGPSGSGGLTRLEPGRHLLAHAPIIVQHLPADRERMGLREVPMAGGWNSPSRSLEAEAMVSGVGGALEAAQRCFEQRDTRALAASSKRRWTYSTSEKRCD